MGKHDTHFTSPSVIATDINTDHLTVHWAQGGLSRFHY